jgi:outer membrane protein assembly factor BamA
VQFTNLGGRMENLRLFAKVGEWQTYYASWSKPLFPSRYDIGISATFDISPDYLYNFLKKEFSGSLTVGRSFFERSRAYCSIIPKYRWGKIWRTDTASEVFDYYQVYGAIGWSTDRRSSGFEPSRGWSTAFETRSNYLYHDTAVKPYVQFLSDMKWYHPALLKEHTIACHCFVLFRTGDAGYMNRVLIGGENSVRGYNMGQIGLRTINPAANNGFYISGEYRFPIYEFPRIPLPMPDLMTPMVGQVTDVAPRITGALIADYGRVSRFPHQLFSTDTRHYQSGTGLGFGIRVLEPSLRIRGSADLVWGDIISTKGIDFNSIPYLHLYISGYY